MIRGKAPIYPVEPWAITEKAFDRKTNYRNETTFSLSNGYIGTRGTFEEAYDFDIDTGLEGNFVNGFYESEKIRYGEANFGSPAYSQSLLNLPNLKETKLYVEGEEFSMESGTVERYARTLHMKEGFLERRLVWTSPKGKTVEIRIERLVSYEMEHIMAIRYEVTPVNFSGKICFVSKLQGEVENHTRKTNPIVDYGPFGRKFEADQLKQEGALLYYEGTTQTSRLTIGCASAHRIVRSEGGAAVSGETEGDAAVSGEKEAAVSGATEGEATVSGAAEGEAAVSGAAEVGRPIQADGVTGGENCLSKECVGGQEPVCTVTGGVSGLEAVCRLEVEGSEKAPVVLEKMICYASSKDWKEQETKEEVSCDAAREVQRSDRISEDARTLEEYIKEELAAACEVGYDGLKEKQRERLRHFWENADIQIRGAESDALIQGLHFNLFHIFQSALRGGKQGMGAKGLSGEGYEGHYFWDTEMYVLPVFLYTAPETAKRLLDFRYATLEKARERARILGHAKGALFPWRTLNGEEASTYYPLGTAQYHINGDIAYALSLYVQATGDREYLKEKGAELLIETARVWADVGSFADCKDGRYCICSVTGPDEYNVLVDNNFYTNLMARENLRDAAGAVRWLMAKEPEKYEELTERLGFAEEELALWDKIIDRMYFPYDEEHKIYPMDDGFMMRKPWVEEKIPEEKRAWLYENYHPLFIMRHRMSKQADAILGMYLHSNLFETEEIRRNYDFYQKVTLHHSSLSTCIFGIVACDVGYVEEAYRYFMQSARMDLDDYHNNFYAGIHAANMAGTWQAVANGFGGMRCQGGKLSFKPVLPEAWESFSFRIRYLGSLLGVMVSREKEGCQVKFTLLEGEPVTFYLRGETQAQECAWKPERKPKEESGRKAEEKSKEESLRKEEQKAEEKRTRRTEQKIELTECGGQWIGKF